MPLTPSNLLLVFLLRAGQMLAIGLPGILAGALIAGLIGPVVRVPDGSRPVRRLLAARGLLLLVPLTSLGAILVADRLRRLGCSWTVSLLALLSGGLAPWMIAWGMARAEVATMGTLVAAAAIVPLVVALVAHACFADLREPPTAEAAAGRTRLRAVLAASADSVRSTALVPVAIGIVVAAAFALALPRGWLEEELGERGPRAALFATGVAVPIVASPEQAMAFAWTALDVGANPGTGVGWLALAGGVHAGTLAWLARHAGWRRAAAVAGLLVGVTLAASFAIDPLLFRRLPDDSDTHVFDGLGRPWHLGDNTGTPPIVAAWTIFQRDVGTGWAALASPAMLSLAALVALRATRGLRCSDEMKQRAGRELGATGCTQPVRVDGHGLRTTRGTHDGVSPIASTPTAPMRLAVPAGLLLAAWVVVGFYAFYPPPDEATTEIRQLSADVGPLLRQGKATLARERIDRLVTMVNRREVGARLRFQSPSAEAKALVERLADFRGRLDAMPTSEAAEEYGRLAKAVVRSR